MKIQSIGGYLSQDEDGFIINDLTVDKIGEKWRAVLEMAREGFVENLGEDLHGVYVRGSVARGLAIDGVSDLDMFALVKPTFSSERIRWQVADFQLVIAESIKKKYDFVSDVEMMLATYDEDFVESNLAMIVKTQSVLLFGEDISERLKNYKADESMMLNFRWLEADILDFVKINNVDFTLKKCSEMMKVILRTGFELVMNRIGKFSPDLYICYRDFSRLYPNKEKEIRQALNWYLNPILDKEKLDNFVIGFGRFLMGI